MKSGTKQLIGVIAIICIALVVIDYAFYDLVPGFGPTLRQKEGPVWTPTDKENYAAGIGMFEASQTCYNSLAPSTALTHASDYDLYWYTLRGTTYAYHGTGGTVASPVMVDMTSEDRAYLYVAVLIHASANFHVDAQKIVDTNSYIDSVMFFDIDDDTVSEFVFKYDMADHSIPNSGYPAIAFKAHCFADDTSFAAVSSLDDLGNVGATKVTKWMEWDMTFSAAAKAVPLAKIEFKVNRTDTTLVQLKQIEVPGRGFLDSSNLVFDETSSFYRWTYTYGLTYDKAYYSKCPTGTKLTRDVDVKADFTLGSTNVTCTLTIWYIDPQTGTLSSDTDDCAATYKA